MDLLRLSRVLDTHVTYALERGAALSLEFRRGTVSLNEQMVDPDQSSIGVCAL